MHAITIGQNRLVLRFVGEELMSILVSLCFLRQWRKATSTYYESAINQSKMLFQHARIILRVNIGMVKINKFMAS